MPAPRKRPAPRVPKPVAEVCNAVIDLLERASITNEQFLVRRPDLGMNSKSMSRHLLGQARPAPALVEAVVTVVATELGADPEALYDEFPQLRRHTGRVELLAGADKHIGTRPLPMVNRQLGDDEWRQRTAWWWSLILDGREFEAAIALDGLFGGDSDAEDRAVSLLALRDPGAVAALLRAVEQTHGLDRAQNLLAAAESVGMGASTAVTEIPNSYLPDVSRPWETSDARLLDRSPEQLISRRLTALLRRGEKKQACAEMAALTESVGVDTADVMAVMANDLDADAAGELLTAMISGDDIDAAVVILCAVFANARSSGRSLTTMVLLSGLLPEHLGTVLDILIDRSRQTSDPAADRELRDLLAFTTNRLLVTSLTQKWVGSHDSGGLAYVFELLLEDQESEPLLTGVDPGSAAQFLAMTVAQLESSAPADRDRLMRAVIRVIEPHIVSYLVEMDPRLAAQLLQLALTQPTSNVRTFLPDSCGGPEAMARLVLAADPEHRVGLLSTVVDGNDRTQPIWHAIVRANESTAREIMVSAIDVDPALAVKLAQVVYQGNHVPAWRDAAECIEKRDLDTARKIVSQALFSRQPRGFISHVLSRLAGDTSRRR
ncbi:hypothetical protein ACFVAV_35405 [Nocardia sp. NPDC057663]|uniref:hypothetical protein n=1 Tax=Nocardia sp. NPDC057663 TaxID=3346201 RepID=UPI00367174B9